MGGFYYIEIELAILCAGRALQEQLLKLSIHIVGQIRMLKPFTAHHYQLLLDVVQICPVGMVHRPPAICWPMIVMSQS